MADFDKLTILRTLLSLYDSTKNDNDTSLKLAGVGCSVLSSRLVNAITLMLRQDYQLSELEREKESYRQICEDYDTLLNGIDIEFWDGENKAALDALCAKVKRDIEGED